MQTQRAADAIIMCHFGYDHPVKRLCDMAGTRLKQLHPEYGRTTQTLTNSLTEYFDNSSQLTFLDDVFIDSRLLVVDLPPQAYIKLNIARDRLKAEDGLTIMNIRSSTALSAEQTLANQNFHESVSGVGNLLDTLNLIRDDQIANLILLSQLIVQLDLITAIDPLPADIGLCWLEQGVCQLQIQLPPAFASKYNMIGESVLRLKFQPWRMADGWCILPLYQPEDYLAFLQLIGAPQIANQYDFYDLISIWLNWQGISDQCAPYLADLTIATLFEMVQQHEQCRKLPIAWLYDSPVKEDQTKMNIWQGWLPSGLSHWGAGCHSLCKELEIWTGGP